MIRGLQRDAFTCEAIFQQERETIFGNHWLVALPIWEPSAKASDQSSYRICDIGDHSAIVIQGPNGELSAFHNVCRHRGTRLINDTCGELRNDCVTCPYHAWSYDTHGQLIGAPNMAQVEDFNRQDFPLTKIPVAKWANLVFLNLSASCEPFAEVMQPLISRLKNWQPDTLPITKTLTYKVQANWKLLFQNYSECYHCPTVHPDLNQQTRYKTATNDLMEGPILGGPMQLSDGYETISQDGKHVGSIFQSLDSTQQRSVYYYTIFPNMFVSAHPDYVMIHQLIPVDVGVTHVHCFFMADPSSTPESLEGAWKMWDTVNRQDWKVCELTQLGAQSPAFQPGPYSNLESMLAAFDQHYRSAMASSA